MLALALLPAASCGPGGPGAIDLAPGAVRCYTSAREIRALAVAADGDVWAGGPGGLLRFRPETGRWEHFTVADGLPDNRVLALLVTARGEVWAGTLGGAARLEGGAFRAWDARQGLPSPAVTALAEEADGTVWAGTLLGIARFTGTAWEAVNDTHEFARRAVMDIARGKDGSLWFAKENALTRHRGGRSWETYQRNVLEPDRRMGLASNSLLSLAVDGEGALLIGTKLGLQRYDGRTWRHERYDGRLATGSGLEDNWIADVAAAPGGALWVVHGESRAVAGGMGAARREPGGEWRYVTVGDGLPSNLVHAVAVGPRGEVWLGTAAGLARWDGGRVDSWRPPETLPGNQVVSLLPGDGGRIRVVTAAGTAILGGADPPSGEKAPASGFAAAAFSDSILYAAPAAGGLLVRRSGGGWAPDEAFARLTVRSLGGGPSGPVLAVTGDGVWSGSAGRWSPLPLDGVPPEVRPLQVARDGAGGLWLAGELPSPAGGRLVTYRADGGRFTPVAVPVLARGAPRLARLLASDGGPALLATPAGLYRHEGGWRPLRIPVARGALGAVSRHRDGYLVAGRNGGLWLGDGSSWREVRLGGRPAPAGIVAIAGEDDRSLWLGTAGQGLLRLDLP